MRDRLIELLKDFCKYDSCLGKQDTTICEDCQIGGELADNLLASGVIVTPCKVGQMVYQTDGTRIYKSCITHIEIYSFATVFYTDGVTFDETAIGQSIYLTREQAERALAERSAR